MKLSTSGERRIGGTDIGKLLGVSAYGNAADVYARIVLGIDSPKNAAMARGIAVEPIIRERYKAQHGAEMLQWVSAPVIFDHEQYSYMTCSPDDVTTELVLCEYKSVSNWAERSWSEGPPIHYVLQCAHNLCVANLDVCHLYAAFGEDRADGFAIGYCETYVIERDQELENTIIDACTQFWTDHVLPKVPPDLKPIKNVRKYNAALKATKGKE